MGRTQAAGRMCFEDELSAEATGQVRWARHSYLDSGP